VKVAVIKMPEVYCGHCGLVLVPEGFTDESIKKREPMTLRHSKSAFRCDQLGKSITVDFEEFWSIKVYPDDETTIPVVHKAAEGPIEG